MLAEQVSTNARIYVNFLKVERFVRTLTIDRSSPFVDQYSAACQGLPDVVPQPDYLVYRSLFSFVALSVQLELRVNNRDQDLHDFLSGYRTALIDCHQQTFLQVYKDNPQKLELFFEEFESGFDTQMPFLRITHIHCAYQILSGLLQMQGIGEIGADQLVPFAIVATVSANPLGLASTSEFLTQFVEPLAVCGSPVDHQQEYTVIQFMSTCQFLFEKMDEAEKGTFPDSVN
jgi:hypothetical protein